LAKIYVPSIARVNGDAKGGDKQTGVYLDVYSLFNCVLIEHVWSLIIWDVGKMDDNLEVR
jgi:hypothetical protein